MSEWGFTLPPRFSLEDIKWYVEDDKSMVKATRKFVLAKFYGGSHLYLETKHVSLSYDLEWTTIEKAAKFKTESEIVSILEKPYYDDGSTVFDLDAVYSIKEVIELEVQP